MRIEQQPAISRACTPFKSVDALYATHLVPKAEYKAMSSKIRTAIESISCARRQELLIANLNKNGITIN